MQYFKAAASNISWDIHLAPKGLPNLPISRGGSKYETFVILDTLELRRGTQKKQLTAKLKESRKTDSKNKSLLFHRPQARMSMVLSVFTTSLIEALNVGTTGRTTRRDIGARYYQSRLAEYEDFFKINFDRTSNRTSPFAKIYIAS